MADEDDDVLTAGDVELETSKQRYGRNNSYSVKPSRARKKETTETHHTIAQQIEAFLKSGKKIQKISHGVSGMPEHQDRDRRQIHNGSKFRTT